MKVDYVVRWSEMARFQLLDKAEYIYSQSQSIEVYDRFIAEIEQLSEKLSYVASAYRDGKFHIYPLKNGHSVKFLVAGDYVIIYAFLPKGINH
ncbi:type II toxin-antitoxin system RelE/ParE family toxin [Haemophilus haemoglobinophilus]|nr:type II toxin-antitoxin system RelE/ParE family toxin [Canicola haemoglobinophilus]